MTPILLLMDKKFTLKTARSPNLGDLKVNRNQEVCWIWTNEWRSLLSALEEGINSLHGLPEKLHNLAMERAEKYMLDHIEEDGTLYSYYSSTFLMIFALLSLGYKKTDPLIVNALAGIMSMKTEIEGLPHMQYTTANVWNTSLIGYALQSAGIATDDTMIVMENQYLLGKQLHKFGDWIIHNRDQLPGGWGFSDVNTIHPDVDDTAASLRLITRIASSHLHVWDRGISWLLSMQNNDGGWAAFEKNTNSKLLDLLPIEKGVSFLINSIDREDWATGYPKGQGMAGAFYIHYHSYRCIFPLLALSHYRKKS